MWRVRCDRGRRCPWCRRDAGEVVGHLALFDESLVAAAHAVECLVRRPECLANLLEAAGGLALERAGVILAARLGETGPEPPPATAVA